MTTNRQHGGSSTAWAHKVVGARELGETRLRWFTRLAVAGAGSLAVVLGLVGARETPGKTHVASTGTSSASTSSPSTGSSGSSGSTGSTGSTGSSSSSSTGSSQSVAPTPTTTAPTVVSGGTGG